MRKVILAAIAFGAATSSVPAYAEAGDLLVKARATYHVRSEGFSFTLNDDAHVVNATVDNAVGGEASVTMFLTNQIAAEFSMGGTTYNLKDENGGKVLSAGMLQSTAIMQFHPLGEDAIVRPYVGAGLSYVNFFGEDLEEVIINEASNPFVPYSAGIQSGFAPVVQVGADMSVNKRLYLNADIKYTSVRTEVYVQNEVRQTVSRRMGSLIIATGVGFRF